MLTFRLTNRGLSRAMDHVSYRLTKNVPCRSRLDFPSLIPASLTLSAMPSHYQTLKIGFGMGSSGRLLIGNRKEEKSLLTRHVGSNQHALHPAAN